jgi:5-hydroxyisourate hydrolase-like protein (transthyretin family)
MTPRRILVLAGALLALAIAVPSTASAAGTYSVWSCRDAGGAPVSAAAWIPFGNVANPLSHSDTCATPGGWLGIQMINPADYSGGSLTGYAFTAPAGTAIDSYRIEMAGQTSSPTGGTHFELGLMIGGDPLVHAGDGCTADIDPCTFGDATGAWDAAGNVFTASALAIGGIAFGGTCTAPTSCVVGVNSSPYPAFGRLYRSEVVLSDPTAPVVGAIEGGATAADPLSGNRSVAADVSDVGGGVFRTQLLVDGAVVDQADGRGRCADPFTGTAPCPDVQRAQFELDTTTLADGPHEVVVRAFDAAMNPADSAPLDVRVDNAPPPPVEVPGPVRTITVPVPGSDPQPAAATQTDAPSQTESPAPKTVALTLKAPAGRQRLPVRGTLRGTAVGADGMPKAGVTVRFERRAFGADDDAWKLVATTTTGADGGYALPVVRRSGQLRIAVGASGYDARPLVVGFVAPIDLDVSASDTTLRNGDTVTLRGIVRADGGAQSGRDVLVQAQVRGAWRTVDSAEIGDDGRIAWTYRFTSTAQTARYRFRFVLPRTAALPWQRLASDPVSVLVSGAGR